MSDSNELNEGNNTNSQNAVNSTPPLNHIRAISAPVPPLSQLRVACISDVPRIASVAVAGFYYSHISFWRRRHQLQFPRDTFQDYASKFAAAVRDRNSVCLVVEDAYVVDESSKTGAKIMADRELRRPLEGERVVVGVAVWKFEEGSKRVGQFMDGEDDGEERFPEGLHRDCDTKRVEVFDPPAHAAEARHFKGCQTMEFIAVHPAYARRGHGERLAKWGLALAEMDGVGQGVLASTRGQKLYTALGYQRVETMIARVEGEEADKIEYNIFVHRHGQKQHFEQ